MKRFLINSAGLLLGSALLATAGFAQTVPPRVLPPGANPPVAEDNGGVVIIQGPYYPVASQMGDLRLVMPGTMLDDSVYLDGNYMGVASQVGDLQMAPGAHDLMLCAPDGTPVYRRNVTVGINETTEVRPFAAPNNGIVGVPSAALPPPTVVPAEQGDLRLTTAYSLRNDAVFVDGTYVGTARLSHDLELTPGTHEISLLAPNGDTDMVTSVGITANQVTRLRADHNQPSIGVNG